MGMTITEKIIAAHSGHLEVSAGQFVYADVDICLGNDITAPIAIEQFETLGVEKVFNKVLLKQSVNELLAQTLE